MITQKERKILIIKYLQKNPLSSPRQIRDNHTGHEYHSKYLKKYLEELVCDEKIGIFHKKYYVIPKTGKEINLLVNIIKSVPLNKPIFKKLKFIHSNKNVTINSIINNCICLYHLKQKINKVENKIPTKSFPQNFIKLLKSFSDDHMYSNYLLSKNYFKKKPIWKEIDTTNNTLEKRISNFLHFHWLYSFEYRGLIRKNKTSLKEIFHSLFAIYSSNRTYGDGGFRFINNKITRPLDKAITERGIHRGSRVMNSEGRIIESKENKIGIPHERPMIIEIGIAIMTKTPAKRKKHAKLMEELTGIEFTKLIPMEGKSNLLKDLPTDPYRNIHPDYKQAYEEHCKKYGMPPWKIIITDSNEKFYAFLDPSSPKGISKKWKGEEYPL